MAGNIIELHTEVPAELEANVFGQFDEHLKLIERTLNVTVISRDGILKILGNEQNAASAKKLIEELTVLAKRGNTITKQNVNYALSLAMEQRNEVLTEIDKDFICNTIQGRPIKPKTLGQKDYVEQIRKKMIVFGLFTDDPNTNPDAKFIDVVENLDDNLLNMGKGTSGSKVGTGGMATKLTAAQIASAAGVDMVIANGADFHIIHKITEGRKYGTLFVSQSKKEVYLIDIIDRLL